MAPSCTAFRAPSIDSSDHCLYFFLEETGDLDREAWTLDREAGALDREAGALDREAGTFLACFLFTGIARHCYELLQATPAGIVSGTQTSFFFFVGAGKNEGLGHA